MKAIQITEPGTIKLVELDKPTPAAGEILLKVNFVGYCGSDLSTYLGKNPMVSYPRIPGHEIAATIEGLGEGVPASFAAGQQATVVPYTSCGQCASCPKPAVPHGCGFQTLSVNHCQLPQPHPPRRRAPPAAPDAPGTLSKRRCWRGGPMTPG